MDTKFKTKKSFLRRLKERGLTLIEAAMVLAIVTLVIAGVMLFFQNASNNNKINSTLAQIAAVQSSVQSMFNGQPTYNGLTTAIIADSNTLPSKMIGAASTIKHAFNGDLALAAVNADTQYSITIDGIPQEPCARLLSQDLGRGMQSVDQTNGGAGGPFPQRAATPAEAQADCVNLDDNIITWIFF